MGIRAGVQYAEDRTPVWSPRRLVPNDKTGIREGGSGAGLEVWR